MRKFFLFVMLVVFAIFGWRDFVASGRLLAYFDNHPNRKGTCTGLFFLGRYYEIMNKDEKALEAYQRIAERYPASKYGMEAQFGVASSLERLKRWREAAAEYVEFTEKYPRNKYTASVQNNIEILKTR